MCRKAVVLVMIALELMLLSVCRVCCSVVLVRQCSPQTVNHNVLMMRWLIMRCRMICCNFLLLRLKV